MQLTSILTGAFAVLANAHWQHPHGYGYQQQKKAVPVVGSYPNQNSGFVNGSYSNFGTGTGTGNDYQQQKKAASVVGSNLNQDSGSVNGPVSSLGTGTGTGTTGNDPSNLAPALPPQSSGPGTTNPDATPPSSGNSAGGSTASFTQYGPCNDASKTSCAWYSSSGYNAAISQAVYGGAPGTGASGACGVCWRLTPHFPGANEIVVKVNNLCPDDGNPLCAQPADVDINFDLCQDSGAAGALFGSSGTEQVNGTAAQVDCSEWSGGPNVY